MANVFDLLPCDSSAKMVTSVIQTRIFTTTGPLPIDCDNVTGLDDQSSCNVWSNALQNLSVIPCSSAPPDTGGGGSSSTSNHIGWAGLWVNVDPNTGDTVKIEISLDPSNGDLSAHFWGACSPDPCDNGTATAPISNPVTLIRDHGFKTETYTLTLDPVANTIHSECLTHYTNGSPDRTAVEDFH